MRSGTLACSSGSADAQSTGRPLRTRSTTHDSSSRYVSGSRRSAKRSIIVVHLTLPEFLSEPDEDSFGAPDVAEPIRVFELGHFADELRAAFAEPGERIVDVLHGKHDAQVTEGVHRNATVIGDHRWRKESGDLEPAVTVRRTHHGNFHAHIPQSSDAICPVSLDWGAPLELKAKFGKKLNGGINVFNHDADVVHTLHRHDVSMS